MLRRFTEDVGKRFKKGDLKDYPVHVWNKIAQDRNRGRIRLRGRSTDLTAELGKFSVAVEDGSLQSSTRTVHRKVRLGTATKQ